MAPRPSSLGFLGGRLSQESIKSLYICIAYGVASVLISLVYKALLSSYKYEGKFLLLAVQQLISLLFCFFAGAFLKGVPGFEVPKIRRAELRESIWPGILNVANIVVGCVWLLPARCSATNTAEPSTCMQGTEWPS